MHWMLALHTFTCTGLIDDLLSLAGSISRGGQSHLVWILKWSNCTSLMSHQYKSAQLFFCCWRHSNSFLNHSLGVYAMYQSSSWYAFTPSLPAMCLWNIQILKNIIIISVHLLFYLSTCCHVHFFSGACNKSQLLFILYSKYINFWTSIYKLSCLDCWLICPFLQFLPTVVKFTFINSDSSQSSIHTSDYFQVLQRNYLAFLWLHGIAISLWLIAALHMPNCGMLEWLYVHNLFCLCICWIPQSLLLEIIF